MNRHVSHTPTNSEEAGDICSEAQPTGQQQGPAFVWATVEGVGVWPEALTSPHLLELESRISCRVREQKIRWRWMEVVVLT